jgi:PmbA protein
MKTDRALPDKIIGIALKNGAEQVEVFHRASRKLSAEVKSGEVAAVESAVSIGYGVRVIVEGRPGFYYSTNEEDAEKAVLAALDIARFTEPDRYLGFPEPRVPESPEINDPSIAAVTEEEAIERAMSVEKAAFASDKRVKRTRKAMVSFYSGETSVVNSKGISYGYPSTSVSAHIMAVAEEGGESQMGWGFGTGRFIEDVDFEEVGTESGKRAILMLGAKKTTAVKAPVVLDNHIAADFLSICSSMLSSENVQKGKSLLAGKLGHQIISKNLDIIDDGVLYHGPGSRPIDDEGVPALRKVLVREGVLEGFMYNTRTAKKDDRDSTGNAVRGRFSAVPTVGPLNLYISTAGKRMKKEEMFASIERGLYIIEAMGMHTANPISGQFSIGVSGMWVEGGKPVYPVKEAVISGNMLDFFGVVNALGDDLRFFGNIGSPSLLMGNTDISA